MVRPSPAATGCEVTRPRCRVWLMGSGHGSDADLLLDRTNPHVRRASGRCAGPGCPAAPSGTTRSASSSSRSPTTWPTSCAASRCPTRSRGGRSPLCARSWSRAAPGSCATGGTWSSSSPRWRCRGRFSPRSCAGSIACEDRPWRRSDGPWQRREPRGEPCAEGWRSPAVDLRWTPEAASRRSRCPGSHLRRAFC